MTDVAERITSTVSRLQRELKCGICCSTFKDPILSTCYHMFCRTCINACFERKRKVQCPICRTDLDKRSCRDAYQTTMAVQNYLKLAEAFKKDIADQTPFKSLPPEKAFMESQMPLDITIIPENDGKRCAPDFAIPLLPVRKRRQSKPKPDPVVEDFNLPTSSTSFVPPEPVTPEPIFKQPIFAKPLPPTIKKVDVELVTEPYKISTDELRTLEVSEHINTIREVSPELDDIDALFRLIPSMRPLLEKNMKQLMLKMGVKAQIEKEDLENTPPDKTENRVSFVRIVTPERSQSQKLLRVQPEVEIKEEEVHVEEEKAPVIPPAAPVDDDDEVVMDSEGEQQDEDQVKVDVTSEAISTTLDTDKTAPAIQDESDVLEENLKKPPIYITVSRLHNDEDEVELLSDFHYKFLSDKCRFSDEVDAHTTHLVMMNSEQRSIPQKSTSYLLAIARKCIIVSRQWLVDCVRTGTLQTEGEYTITSCPTIPSSLASPEIGWLRARNDPDGKLFTGCRFMILRKFTMNQYFDYKKLIELVQLCGGELLSAYENLSPEKLFIVFSKHSKAIGDARNMEEVYKCEVVTMEWVLDSICEYSILPTDRYKAVDETKTASQD